MSDLKFVVEDSARDPNTDIWFAVPPGFKEVPLENIIAPHGSPAAQKMKEAWTTLLDSATDPVLRQQLTARIAQVQQFLVALIEVGTVHCSLGLHRDDANDREVAAEAVPLLSLFTIAWRGTAWAPPGVTAARAIATAGGHSGIEYLELPCGPASISETVRQAPAESGLPQEPLLQIHAHLPHPDGKRLALLTLSTTAVTQREDFRGMLQQICGMVSFENPL